MQNDEISTLDNWNITKLSNGKSLYHKCSNARVIEIHSDCFIEENYVEDEELCIDKKLHSLDFGVYRISIGNEFSSKILDREVKYKISNIEKLSDKRYSLTSHLRNKSSIYLTPMLGGIKEQYLYDNYLINTYIDKNTENYLYLLYRFIPDDNYRHFEKEITTHPLYIDKKDCKEFVQFKFAVPEEYRKDIRLFKKGKYSRFSSSLKKKIIDYFDLTEKNEFGHTYCNPNNNIIGTLYRSKELKSKLEDSLFCTIDDNIDLDSKPNLDNEYIIC